MVVVGTGAYEDQAEAFPLDKKTLNQIALRSFFVGSSINGETGESIGWTWAMMPGLKKIHTDQQDLALSMGHNLEFVRTGSFFSTLAMGIVLSMEQQKADLETIRSVRTAACGAADSLSASVFRCLLIPFTAAMACSLSASGSVKGPLLFLAILLVLTVALRFGLLYYGYSKGTKAMEKLTKKRSALKNAAVSGGLFMVGAMTVYYGRNILTKVSIENSMSSGSSITLNQSLQYILPGVIPVLVTLLLYYLLTKKNWSVFKCVLLVIAIGLAGSLLGIWGGVYTSPFSFPWEA